MYITSEKAGAANFYRIEVTYMYLRALIDLNLPAQDKLLHIRLEDGSMKYARLNELSEQEFSRILDEIRDRIETETIEFDLTRVEIEERVDNSKVRVDLLTTHGGVIRNISSWKDSGRPTLSPFDAKLLPPVDKWPRR